MSWFDADPNKKTVEGHGIRMGIQFNRMWLRQNAKIIYLKERNQDRRNRFQRRNTYIMIKLAEFAELFLNKNNRVSGSQSSHSTSTTSVSTLPSMPQDIPDPE